MRYILFAGLAALAAPQAMAQESHDCVIEPFMVLEIGAAAEGVVEDIHMTRGATVRKGDILARLEGTVEEATLALSEAQARSTVAIDIARARADLARKEMERAKQLASRNVGTQSDLELAEAAQKQADLELVQAQEQSALNRFDRDRAKALLERRTVRSPIDGILLRRLVGPGEYVYSQAKIAQIATVDPLYVDVFLPTQLYKSIAIGQVGTVRPAEPISGIYKAKVTAIDKVFDAASDTFGVRLELPNPGNKLPAGVDCTIEFGAG